MVSSLCRCQWIYNCFKSKHTKATLLNFGKERNALSQFNATANVSTAIEHGHILFSNCIFALVAEKRLEKTSTKSAKASMIILNAMIEIKRSKFHTGI